MVADEQPRSIACPRNITQPAEPRLAQESVQKLIAFDMSLAVFILIAHDSSLPKFLPSMNNTKGCNLNT